MTVTHNERRTTAAMIAERVLAHTGDYTTAIDYVALAPREALAEDELPYRDTVLMFLRLWQEKSADYSRD